VTFLPFHLQWLQWLLRLILLADIAIAGLFWRRIWIASKPTIARLLRATAAAIVALALLLFSMCIATYPGEWMNENLRSVAMIPTSANPKWSDDRGWTSLHAVLFSGAADEVTGKPRSLLSNRLILTNQSFVDSGKLGTLEISQRFRGRDLHDAIFIGADLRKADFTGSVLINADFSYAKLQQAQFSCASEGYKDPEDFFGGDKQLCSDLRGAKLDYADLAGTSFQNVRIQGATFLFAKLYGAKFSIVYAGGASFNYAELQGASLEGDFKGASFFQANLIGADLQGGEFTAARFNQSLLQGASIGNGSKLDAAYLSKASGYRLHAEDDNYTAKKIYFDSFDPSTMLWIAGRGYSDFEAYLGALRSEIRADEKIKTTVVNRMSVLKPNGTRQFQTLVRELSSRLKSKLESQALSRDDYTREVTDEVYYAICFDESPPYVVRGMLRSGIVKAVGADIPRMVSKLTDDKKQQWESGCSGARALSDQLISQIARLTKSQ
jgi:uncharacterized protein YjbI with pentapeptide repeats